LKPKTKSIILFVLTGLFLFAANYAQADLVKCGGPTAGEQACTIADLIKTIVAIINLLFSWAWLVSTLLIVWGGWGMVTAGGNAENIEGAKTVFKQAVIGFFLIMASFVLINFVIGILFGDGRGAGAAFVEVFSQFKLKP
jgi:hypothetical protein